MKKKKDEKEEYGFEVYIARFHNFVVYVGEGKSGRSSHLTSGTSHVYEANRFHFIEQKLDIEVIPVKTKRKAKNMEAKLILEHRPIWNVDIPNGFTIKQRINLLRNKGTALITRGLTKLLKSLTSGKASGDGILIFPDHVSWSKIYKYASKNIRIDNFSFTLLRKPKRILVRYGLLPRIGITEIVDTEKP